MSEEDKILPEEIPPEQPANKDSSDEIISSAEPVTEAEQPQTTNLSSEALPAGQAGSAKEEAQRGISRNYNETHFNFERPSFVALQRVQSEKSCIPFLSPHATSFRAKRGTLYFISTR